MPYIGNVLTSFAVETGNIADQAVTAPKLSATGGTNGQVLGLDAGGNLVWTSDPAGQWVTSGSNIYFDGGNIGIGTASPSYALHVNSGSTGTSALLESTVAGCYLNFKNSSGSGVYVGATSTAFFVETNGAERARIDSSGRLGLGTSTPDSNLEIVNATGSADNNLLKLHSSASTSSANLILEVNNGNTAQAALKLDNANKLHLQTYGGGALNNRLSIDGDGKVGIGTTSITGFSDYTTVQLGSSSSGAAMRLVANGDTPGIDDFVIYKNTSGSYLRSYGDPLIFYGDSSEYGRWDTSGRLLVGTSSARSQYGVTPKSQVEGTDNTSSFGAIRNSNDAGGAYLLLGKSRGTTTGSSTIVQFNDVLGGIYFQGADGADIATPAAGIEACVDTTPGADDMPGRLVFYTTADGANFLTERMRIGQSALTSINGVYIHTTGNSANVHVDSSAYLLRSTSSIKYKTDVEDAEDQYSEALLQCRPVWYRSTCQRDNPAHSYWGFIAEEVAEIDPRLVHWKTTEPVVQENGSIENVPCDPEPEGVAYERFVPHLLNLIKRQGEAIAELQAEVAALKAQ